MKPIKYMERFRTRPDKENFYGYNEPYGFANMEFTSTDKMYIYNVEVNEDFQGNGFGREMMSRIREAFPTTHIYVDTEPSSDGFWVKMMREGIIDSIRNRNVISVVDG